MRLKCSLVLLIGLSLLLVLRPGHIAGASRLEDLSALDEPVTYEQFLEAVTAQQQAEDAHACEEAQGKEAACPATPERVIHLKARQAYDAHADRLDEQAFQRRQEEDARDRAQREAKIQALFQQEYDEKIAASRDDPTAIELAIGTALCDYRINSPTRAIITEITIHRTTRLRLYIRTRRGDVENGSGEVIVRKHPDGPHIYEIEILSVANELGQADLVPLGTTKTVAPCMDEAHSPDVS